MPVLFCRVWRTRQSGKNNLPIIADAGRGSVAKVRRCGVSRMPLGKIARMVMPKWSSTGSRRGFALV